MFFSPPLLNREEESSHPYRRRRRRKIFSRQQAGRTTDQVTRGGAFFKHPGHKLGTSQARIYEAKFVAFEIDSCAEVRIKNALDAI